MGKKGWSSQHCYIIHAYRAIEARRNHRKKICLDLDQCQVFLIASELLSNSCNNWFRWWNHVAWFSRIVDWRGVSLCSGIMQLAMLAPYNNLASSVAAALVPTLLAPKINTSARKDDHPTASRTSSAGDPLAAKGNVSPNSCVLCFLQDGGNFVLERRASHWNQTHDGIWCVDVHGTTMHEVTDFLQMPP